MSDTFLRRARITYALVWVPMAALLWLLLAIIANLGWLQSAGLAAPLSIAFGLICQSTYYVCRSLPLRTTPIGRLLLLHGTAALLATALWILGAGFLARSLTGDTLIAWIRIPTLLAGVGLLYYLLSAAFHYVVLSLEAARQAEQRSQEIQTLAREAELRALRAQINPHFLFNSLNSIAALCTQDGVRARSMCIHLSDFLRATLRLGEQAEITFGEELSVAREYLAVEQIRFGARLTVEEQVEADTLACRLPPLLLQPLVENAVKHGTSSLPEGGRLSIRARLQDSRLLIDVQNPYDPESRPRTGSGRGLRIVEERLRALYGEQVRFLVQHKEGVFRVALELPARRR